jgi:hypothetical protein
MDGSGCRNGKFPGCEWQILFWKLQQHVNLTRQKTREVHNGYSWVAGKKEHQLTA